MPKCGSKTSTVPVIWATFGILSAQSKWFHVAIGDRGRHLVISLWPQRQSNNHWSGDIAAHPTPKKLWVQKSAGKVLISIFSDQDGIILIDYLPKGQTINTEYYLSLLVQLKDILKEKHCGKVTKGVLFLHNNAPAHWALATQRNWPSWASNILITHPVLQIWRCRTTTCSLDWKSNWKVTIFCSTWMWMSLLPRRPGWMDNLLNFQVACKS